MSDTNSIWPNGMGVDENGYAVFYPMGTNKVEIPKNSPHWPKGNKLIGQFVYKDGKLVGFCDTKAMTATSGDIIVMPYETIDTEFDSIEKDSIQIHAPKATYKKASWSGIDGKIDIPDVEYKYKGCKNVTQIKSIDANYLENDIVDGKWTELLSSLTNGNSMFYDSSIVSFNSDLTSLDNGYKMFEGCTNLSSFVADISSITNGYQMFRNCEKLTSFSCDMSFLTSGSGMFANCSNIATFEGDLSSLESGGQMFYKCSNLTSFDCKKMISLKTGDNMFYECEKLVSFTSDLSSLTNGSYMFYKCSSIDDFNIDIRYITNGSHMFDGCSKLTSFKCPKLSLLTNGLAMFLHCYTLSTFKCSDLSSLTNGLQMFSGCNNLMSFDTNLNSLENGQSMFSSCFNLSAFDVILSSVTNGLFMFASCSNLSSFKSNLSSLNDGSYMFHNCSSLTSFKSDLSSLTNGSSMFNQCKLDALSVKNIIDTINNVETGEILIGMGCDNNQSDKDLFAQEVGYTDMSSLLETLQSKGWTVTAQYNGRPSSTFSLRKPESLPVFVKLVEVVLPVNEEEISPIYEYTSQDGTKFYNLDWFHETTGSTDGYTQFSSLEEAITTFNIKPIEK